MHGHHLLGHMKSVLGILGNCLIVGGRLGRALEARAVPTGVLGIIQNKSDEIVDRIGLVVGNNKGERGENLTDAENIGICGLAVDGLELLELLGKQSMNFFGHHDTRRQRGGSKKAAAAVQRSCGDGRRAAAAKCFWI